MAYTNENRPKGWYNVKGKGRRYWTGKGWQNNAPTSLAPSKSEIKKGLDDIDKGGQSLNSTLKQGAKATVKAGQAAGQRIVDNLNPLNALIKPPKLPNGQAGQEASNGSEIRPKGTVATKGGKKVIWDGKQWVEQGQYGPPAPQTPAAPRPKSPAVGAPIHASPQNFGSVSKIQDGVMSGAGTSPYAPQAGAAPKPNTPQPSSYRDGGKGLYKGSEEYVKATGGNYNPLMQRTFGYQTGGQPTAQPAPGTAPQSNDKVNTPDQRDQYVSPAGKEYYGPGYGAPQPKVSPQYNGNDEPGALGQAENPMKLLSDLLNRKKLSISVSN